MRWLYLHAPGRAAALLAGALALLAVALGHAADIEDKDWPCQQRKVPVISPGQVWTGPSLEAVGDSWQDDETIADLARKIAARRTDLDEARSAIAAFAAKAGPDKNRKLIALAAGVLAIINSDRASIIAGIGRYAKRQRDLAAKIERETAELDALPQNGTAEQVARRNDLLEMQTWDTRILQERERSLTYVCELPVQLEQRAFALGREIRSHLDP
jgi:hypothetical protein